MNRYMDWMMTLAILLGLVTVGLGVVHRDGGTVIVGSLVVLTAATADWLWPTTPGEDDDR